ncbi:retrovirus-related Pol polyprotein from transposon 17.6 [Trichonephila clavipes]|uniref:Retrovirus-related Pol polyprotein from transposon 17.6 n=1 Tax=Trichonephila clavipes TaxID=2585209 RepID=A0A8X6VQW8_TRICX|nr:retrovirus-related Pol polyprotein from transposon 17.6 [Trichonephila clavipes]
MLEKIIENWTSRLDYIRASRKSPMPEIIFKITIASPLTDALKGKFKKEKITWDEKCEKAFEELKAKLVSQPKLFAPDFSTEFILQTGASEVGVGVVLSQRIEGEEHPIVFLGKKFSKAERNYSTVERELAAIIFGLKRLKHYLDGRHLDAFTRGRIVEKLEEGRSATSVAAEFGIAHNIVSRLWRQFQTTGTAIRGFSS